MMPTYIQFLYYWLAFNTGNSKVSVQCLANIEYDASRSIEHTEGLEFIKRWIRR